MTTPAPKARPMHPKPKAAPATRRTRADMKAATKALVFQGGGALGSYQAGVFAELDAHRKRAHWIAGVWAAGQRDMHTTLANPQALRSDVQTNGVTTYDLGDPDAIRIKRPMAASPKTHLQRTDRS
ncbi:hypothetical protein [Variovorax sp. KK3]|uniref:hypothetical protein n=1 Tax=Variovorax sp. KK3 TaxID=1855728 RepID=UPI003AABB5DB